MVHKKILLMVLVLVLLVTTSAFADEKARKMQFIVTSPDAQTQMMAMVLSTQSMMKGGNVSVLLCGPGGDIALKGSEETVFMPIKKSPQMLLKGLIKKGIQVQVCPLYLPAKGLGMDALVDGVTKAKPPVIAAGMVQEYTEIITF
ncbi:MAG: hypothetical protein C0603_02865 [Denitrovibrio sp.]|nr:MAG: hypothetical protein C0603_02865 [Denitrovibrio sp.]